ERDGRNDERHGNEQDGPAGPAPDAANRHGRALRALTGRTARGLRGRGTTRRAGSTSATTGQAGMALLAALPLAIATRLSLTRVGSFMSSFASLAERPAGASSTVSSAIGHSFAWTRRPSAERWTRLTRRSPTSARRSTQPLVSSRSIMRPAV